MRKTISVNPALVKYFSVAIQSGSYSNSTVASQNAIRFTAAIREQNIVRCIRYRSCRCSLPPDNTRWEQTFTWTSSCASVPDYVFQMLKIYGGDEALELDDKAWERALTIQTESSAASLTLSMAEGSGTYYWRVIPLGNKPGGISNPDNWGAPSAPVKLNNYLHPDRDKNWIYSRTFTEGNHQSEKLIYANGLQQESQSVTRLQGEGKIIAAQTYQDYIGRGALMRFAGSANSQNLKYVPGLLKRMEQRLTI